jgi:hypothetical protein
MEVLQDENFIVNPPPSPTAWERFRERPALFLTLKLYDWRRIVPNQPLAKPVSVICVSNTYYQQPRIPEGDILIHAGDLTSDGSLQQFQQTLNWLKDQPHPIKIVVAGMNDHLMDRKRERGSCWKAGDRAMVEWGDIYYLENSGFTLTAPNGRQLRIWGSPNSPFYGKLGFQYPRTHNFWLGKIPKNLDILITHTPPYGHLDSLTGCYHLLTELWFKQPRLHVFGRSREDHGIEWLQFDMLQAAVELSKCRDGGLYYLWMAFKGFVQSWYRPATKANTLLVNACITGGFWNIKRREPIKVVI